MGFKTVNLCTNEFGFFTQWTPSMEFPSRQKD